jgi:putative ABC transport system permease protein
MMSQNLIKHSFRSLNRQKSYFLINMAGLSIGIACSLIIALFIIHELSYDAFNEKGDNIYRLVVHGIIGDRELSYACVSAPVGPTMQQEFPEVEDFTRINALNAPTVKYSDRTYTENGFIESDSSFFNIFSIPLIRGNRKTVLSKPHTLVLSKSTATKFFGDTDPIDKLLKVGDDEVYYRITGVMEDIPETSHLRANMIGSFITDPNSKDTYWANNNYPTYILLKPGASPEQVNAKIPGMIRKYMGVLVQKSLGITIDEFINKNKYTIYLQPMKDIHLNPSITQVSSTKPASNPKYLYIFGSVAVLILIIASINFMNLSTAQASKRAKEVGIKKVSGSSKGLLIRQFSMESMLLSLISLVFAIVLIENVLPYFNNLLGIELQMNLFSRWFMIPLLLAFSVLVGLLSGSYPAFFLSSFNPAVVLKGKLNNKMKHGWFRSILVVLQFSISIILIVGTIIMVRQIRFMLNKDLGFNKEQLMVIARADAIGNHVTAFKEALGKIPGVMKISASTAVPGHSESGKTYTVEGQTGDVMDFKINYIDYDFFDTYGIKISSGRDFNESFAADNNACIVNESAIKQLNLNNPFAANLVDGYERLNLVGIVKNFNFESVQSQINPYIFRYKGDENNYGYISLKLSKEATTSTIKETEKVWDAFASGNPFQYFFMDQDFAQKYKEEKQGAQLSVIFSVLAVIIASLGLFGLTSFTIEQRTKEIGIRKTMGATVRSIFYLISKEFVLLVSISTLIAWPLIYYFAKNWLQNFYYRIELRPFDFLSGFMIALVIALFTISYKTVKSARINPVTALRYE